MERTNEDMSDPFGLDDLNEKFGKHYMLIDGKVVTTKDVLEWARWFEKADRHVADETIGDVRVSTVFLGTDHNFLGNGRPILYETMIFGGTLDGEMRRYCTFQEAEQGHAATCDEVRSALPPDAAPPTGTA